MATHANNRKTARTSDLRPTRITLKGTALELNDISSGGIGVVLVEGGPEFVTGERLDAIPLEMKNRRVTLRGVVSHISVSTDKTVCGIRFLLTGDDVETVLQFKREREVR